MIAISLLLATRSTLSMNEFAVEEFFYVLGLYSKPIFRFFAPQRGGVAPIKMKFGRSSMTNCTLIGSVVGIYSPTSRGKTGIRADFLNTFSQCFSGRETASIY